MLETRSKGNAADVYHEALTSLGAAMWSAVPAEGRTTFITSEIEAMLGYPAADWTERANFWLDHMEPADHERVIAFCERLAGNPGVADSLDFRMRNAEGRTVWVRSVARASEHGGGIVCSGVIFDITHLRAAQEALAEAAAEKARAQEEERRRIARELHDDINQRIAIVALDLDRLRMRTVQDQPPSAEELDELWTTVSRISRDVHALALELPEIGVTREGLVDALRSLCDAFSTRSPIRIVTEGIDPTVAAIDDATALALYRVAQEALHNVLRHSHADAVYVRLRDERKQVVLEIIDTGVGMDLGTEPAPRARGLVNMRERIEAIGGRLWIVSSPGRGTRIRVEVPAPPPNH